MRFGEYVLMTAAAAGVHITCDYLASEPKLPKFEEDMSIISMKCSTR